MALAQSLLGVLSGVPVKAWRLSLETPGVMATLPMVRGVWGAALHELSPEAYREVFAGGSDVARATPAYLLRPVQPEAGEQTAIEWLLFAPAFRHEPVLWRAWDIASGMGLGEDRRRFFIRAQKLLGPDGRPAADQTPQARAQGHWALGQAQWPLSGDPAETPVELAFAVPLRLTKRHALIQNPTLSDVVVAALRRIEAISPAAAISRLKPECLSAAADVPCLPWKGQRLDFQRYSARQEQEIELRGVQGSLILPEGAGPLWPLLAALRFVHVGKGTVFGLGQPILQSPGQTARMTEPYSYPNLEHRP